MRRTMIAVTGAVVATVYVLGAWRLVAALDAMRPGMEGWQWQGKRRVAFPARFGGETAKW